MTTAVSRRLEPPRLIQEGEREFRGYHPMTYGKRIAAGLVGALLACGLWLVATVIVPIVWQVLAARLTNVGGGFAAATVDSNALLIAAVAGFVGGWYWRARKGRR